MMLINNFVILLYIGVSNLTVIIKKINILNTSSFLIIFHFFEKKNVLFCAIDPHLIVSEQQRAIYHFLTDIQTCIPLHYNPLSNVNLLFCLASKDSQHIISSQLFCSSKTIFLLEWLLFVTFSKGTFRQILKQVNQIKDVKHAISKALLLTKSFFHLVTRQ